MYRGFVLAAATTGWSHLTVTLGVKCRAGLISWNTYSKVHQNMWNVCFNNKQLWPISWSDSLGIVWIASLFHRISSQELSTQDAIPSDISESPLPRYLPQHYRGSTQHQSKVWTHLLIQCFFFIFHYFCVKQEQEYVLDFRFFKEATFCFDDSFALSWHSLNQLHEPQRILKDDTCCSHSLFTLLPSGLRYRSICCHTPRLKSSFIPPGCGTAELILWDYNIQKM